MTPNAPADSDTALAHQAQGGNALAFEELVYRYEKRVFAFVRQFCRNQDDAREITQDAFVKAFQSLALFDARRDFASWIFTIARRKCIDRHRASPPITETVTQELAGESNPAELLAQREEGHQLWRFARQHLGEIQFQALWLRYAEDMSTAQIAGVLEKTRVHVKVLLFRARQTLARELERRGAISRSLTDQPAPRELRGFIEPHRLKKAPEIL